MPSVLKFVLFGLLVAGVEEGLTQGLLKGGDGGWVIATLIAFTPFLILMWLVGRWLHGRQREWVGALVYYLVAGGIGLAFEWSLMGLAPWRQPHLLQIPFQLGMFSFWATVAFAPRLLLDRRDAVSGLRGAYRIALVVLAAAAYTLTLTASPERRFGVGIVSVIGAFFVLTVLHVLYLRALSRQPRAQQSSA